MKILVTGGAGFIASHIVDLYVEKGHQVVIIDNFSTGKKENLNPKAKFYELDIFKDTNELEKVFKKEKEYGLMDKLASINNLKKIKQLISSKKSLTAKEIHGNEVFYNRNLLLINERYYHGNWKKIWANKINDDLIRPLKNYQTGQRSYDRIKTYN